MGKYSCYGNRNLADDVCFEVCTEEQRRHCYIETNTEKLKTKWTSWLRE